MKRLYYVQFLDLDNRNYFQDHLSIDQIDARLLAALYENRKVYAVYVDEDHIYHYYMCLYGTPDFPSKKHIHKSGYADFDDFYNGFYHTFCLLRDSYRYSSRSIA